jgi:hypothetical protein
MRFSSAVLLAATVLSLAGCANSVAVRKDAVREEPHFWERADATSAIYQRGPKAQQMLNRDISRCVVEIHELERLGAIRQATPAELAREEAESVSNDPRTPEGALARWQTPDHDGNLRAEFLPYHDFETCMINKGWQRVEHVPYEVAEEGRDVYYDTILGQQYRTKHDLRPQIAPSKAAPYSGVNQ